MEATVLIFVVNKNKLMMAKDAMSSGKSCLKAVQD